METVRLGSDAIALLITTCNASGILQVSTALESYSISMDNTSFVVCSSLDNRTIAKWNDALTKLEYYGLITTENSVLYRVTPSGYKASDDLEKQIGTESVKCSNCNYHGASDSKDECPICKCAIGGRENIVLDAIKKNPSITRRQLSELLGYSENTVSRLLNNLTEKAIIERIGSSKTGTWRIK